MPSHRSIAGWDCQKTPSDLFRERFFFAERDNWMLPAFETLTLEALHWSKAVQAVLS